MSGSINEDGWFMFPEERRLFWNAWLERQALPHEDRSHFRPPLEIYRSIQGRWGWALLTVLRDQLDIVCLTLLVWWAYFHQDKALNFVKRLVTSLM